MHSPGARDEWQKPHKVISSLKIRPGERVADLGAGDGYFTFLLAEATGPRGCVFAIDVDREALAGLSQEAQKRGLLNIKTVLAGENTSGLAPQSVDLILICNTYHHLVGRTAYLRRLMPALRSGGRIAIIELDDLPWYQALFHGGHKTSADTIHREMNDAGFILKETHDFLEHQNFQVFSDDLSDQ